jgi:hypothetical protein
MDQADRDSVLLRLAVAIEDAPMVTGAKRARIFQAVRDGELTIRKAGRSSLVEIAELQRWLRSLPTKGRAPTNAPEAA